MQLSLISVLISLSLATASSLYPRSPPSLESLYQNGLSARDIYTLGQSHGSLFVRSFDEDDFLNPYVYAREAVVDEQQPAAEGGEETKTTVATGQKKPKSKPVPGCVCLQTPMGKLCTRKLGGKVVQCWG